jgi:hypothetical protein
MDGAGFKRLQAAPGAEALRENTVAVQAAARAEAAAKIAAAKKTKPTKPKAAKKAKATTKRLTDDMKIVVVKTKIPSRRALRFSSGHSTS